jgi:hypothetical protein
MSRDPSSLETAQYTIRNKPNPLQKDRDVEADISYRINPASKVTVAQWKTCAATFSGNYGVWGPRAQDKMGAWAVPGEKVAMSSKRIEAQCRPDGANNILITATTNAGEQIGHCFVSQWTCQGDRVWWITQMVVRLEFRDERRAIRVSTAIAVMLAGA